MLRGFGGFHESEALEGALPRGRNNPRAPAFGLYAEQINGTSFTVPRAHNRRVWAYRIRPSTCIAPWRPLAHPTFHVGYLEARPAIALCGWRPRPIEGELDFLDGLATYGGAGDPALRRGFAAHQYVATEDMGRRALTNHDGDLLVLPDTGRLAIRTELGAFEVGPGQLAVIPRALVFKVDLRDGPARGYVFEAYARHFELPERGVIGANAVTDARDFEAPEASYEEDDEPWALVAKQGGALHATERTGSPFDVVAWHGNLVPYRYDLSSFVPVGAIHRDHPDPSLFTVLSAPLDHPGEHTADLVVFPERWDVTEDTFRPPYFHRNAATELNGIVQGPDADRVFARGGLFLTPPHTPHGVPDQAVKRQLEREDDAPVELGVGERWMQLESTFPMQLSRWAREATHLDPAFGEPVRRLSKRFTPPG
ncbi:MAG TPA: homogentisate 1,2-dioxygenase domain-containing protein [Sandaracinaceae bacterium LLY-WYZ-13_1]|nr:homogentisate 1,2-dioxygenase domain-containing protein [Sandaracinaceae bacterium LLY-WYZ-13_1]